MTRVAGSKTTIASARGVARRLVIIPTILVGTLTVVGCGRHSSQPSDARSPATRLAAYRPDGDLRQTFESLSRGTANTARIELLDDNLDAWTARWRLLAEAHETIDVSYFIFSQDVFGMAFLGHLLEKAQHGVRVRMQLDAQGMRMSRKPHDLDCLGFLAGAANFSIRLHRPLGRRLVEALARLDPVLATASDHDKIMIVDGHASVIGGRNIEAKYFVHPDDLPTAFQDVDVVLEGPGIAKALTEVFETTYRSKRVVSVSRSGRDAKRCAATLRLAYEAMDAWLDGRPLGTEDRTTETDALPWTEELRPFPRLRGARARGTRADLVTAETRVIDSLPRPGSDGDAVTQSLARLFGAASRSVLMESPYLVLTQQAATMLEQTGHRGVDMVLLTNSPVSTDNALSQLYFREQWPRLLAKVPELRLYAAGTRHNIHSKFAVFDDQVVLIGSYNLDPFSMLISGEIMVAVWSQAFAGLITARPRDMIGRGAPEVYEYTIKRDGNGDPARTPGGEVAIEFGPDDHIDSTGWPRPGIRWTLVRSIPRLLGLPPFF